MAIFIDTGVFVALRNADDEFHLRGRELMRRVLKCEFGRAFTRANGGQREAFLKRSRYLILWEKYENG